MACKYQIKVVEGNEFALVLPLKRRTYVSDRPIDEDIDCTALTNVVLKIGDTTYAVTLDFDGVKTIVPATLKKGVYDIVLTATYKGSEIRAAYFEAIVIVAWNEQSDAEQYIAGSPIVLGAAFIIGGTLTDAELEELKAEFRQATADARQAQADAEAAKAEYESFMTYTPCAECNGMRLKKESLAVTVCDKNIYDITQMPIGELYKFISGLDITERQRMIGDQIIREIRKRTGFMVEVGLDYLNLARATASLSGGEAQRIRLATQINS